jgi:hypothetical protein
MYACVFHCRIYTLSLSLSHTHTQYLMEEGVLAQHATLSELKLVELGSFPYKGIKEKVPIIEASTGVCMRICVCVCVCVCICVCVCLCVCKYIYTYTYTHRRVVAQAAPAVAREGGGRGEEGGACSVYVFISRCI